MTDAQERIWAWEIDDLAVPPNGYYAVEEVDESTEYTRTDIADARVAAAVTKAVRAQKEQDDAVLAIVKATIPKAVELERERIIHLRPDFGATTREPDLERILRFYYGQQFEGRELSKLVLRYIAAIRDVRE